MTNGQVWWSGVKSRCPESEWVGVGGTWLQLMCCAVSRHCVPNFGRRGQIGDQIFGDDFIDNTEVRQRWQGERSKSLSKKVLWAGDGPRAYRGSMFSARTRLQLMCCTTRHLLSSNFGRGMDEGSEVRTMSSRDNQCQFQTEEHTEDWNV